MRLNYYFAFNNILCSTLWWQTLSLTLLISCILLLLHTAETIDTTDTIDSHYKGHYVRERHVLHWEHHEQLTRHFMSSCLVLSVPPKRNLSVTDFAASSFVWTAQNVHSLYGILLQPYLTLPSGWAGCYTCPALSPYQFGPMRNPDVTIRSQWSAVKPKNHQLPGTGDV